MDDTLTNRRIIHPEPPMTQEFEDADAGRVTQAIQHIQNKNFTQAEALLLDVCSRCPDEYRYEYIEGDTRFIKFWDQQEFIEYVATQPKDRLEKIVWIQSVYPRACYYLAYVLVEKNDYRGAVRWLTKGQAMEPSNPNFLLELGVAYGYLMQYQKSLECYQQALHLPGLSKHDRAVALRGTGVQLIDLQRLDEAKAHLNESLELEPDNPIARDELIYIARLRSGRRI